MKTYIQLFILILGVQNVSACGSPVTLDYDIGGDPRIHAVISFIFICSELFLLVKFIQWLFYKKEAERATRNARRLIYGLLLLPSTILFLLSVKDLLGFLYTTNCVPMGTETITIPDISFGTSTPKER